MSNGKEINNGDTCFFNHRKHSIVGVLYPKLRPKQQDNFYAPTSIYQQNLLVSLWKRIASTYVTPTGSAGINGLLKK